MKKILFVGTRDLAHSSAGGYHRIAYMKGSRRVVSVLDSSAKNFLLFRKILAKLGCIWIYTVLRLLRPYFDVTHCFMADLMKRPLKKSKKHKLVLTVHLDVKKRKKRKKEYMELLLGADKVVALSTQQTNELKQLGVNAVFIPHGFNTPVFKQVDKIIDSLDTTKVNIIMTGKQSRDNELALRIMKATENTTDIRFHLVGSHNNLKEGVSGLKHVTVYPRLSDDEYFTLLSNCDYSFMPLTFATANNAVLESQFMGIQGIYPDISGISDYAAPEPMNIFYKSSEDLLEIMNRLQKHAPDSRLKEYAARFSWDNVYKELNSLYESL